MTDTTIIPDEEVLAAQIDSLAFERLFNKPFCVGIRKYYINKYFDPWGDETELEQSMNIAFWKAVKSYKPVNKDGFRPFLHMVLKRKAREHLKVRGRIYHSLITNASSFDEVVTNRKQNGYFTLYDTLADKSPDIFEQVSTNQTLEVIWEGINSILTPLERECLEASCLDGITYTAIQERLGVGFKTVDNALQRARKKLRSHLERKVG